MKRFKCISGWARNKVGDVVENYMFRRYPPDIRDNNFIEFKSVNQKVEKKVEEPVSKVTKRILKQINKDKDKD